MKYWNRLKHWVLPLMENSIRDFLSWGWLRRWFYRHPGHAEVWNLDSTLTSFILPRLKEWAKSEGMSGRFYYEHEKMGENEVWIEWEKVKNHMVEAFRLLSFDLSLEEEEEKREFVNEGLQLFARYYEGLWT